MQCACAVLYYHLWPVWLYHVVPHCHKNGMNFGVGGLLNTYFDFLYEFLPEKISHTTNNSARYHNKCIQVFM